MELKCPKCGSKNIVKNGYVFGCQRHICKSCKYQFTKLSPAGKPIMLQFICHELYLSGMSMRKIASIVGVTAQSVSRWIKKWHGAYMAEIGNHATLFIASKDNLDDCLGIREKDKLLVLSAELPSQAKYNIVIHLP
ncbi:MAG: IS1 family transposase [Alphaproteobacteria bacterium]|nr:IS1 family transposase [Alphaproteobacteria bacterium]